MTSMIKTTIRRSANMVAAHPEIRTSEDGLRRAYGRNVKRSIGDHRFDVVRVWKLVQRIDNKWEPVTSNVGIELAERFLATGRAAACIQIDSDTFFFFGMASE